MTDAQINFNLDGLEKIRKSFGSMVARVGVLGDKVERKDGDTDLTNSEVGLIQILGSYTNNIPPRDWLTMPIQHEQRAIMSSMNNTTTAAAIERGDAKAVLKKLGVEAEKAIHRAFDSRGFGQWQENAASTIARKGSSAVLIDSRQLERSVSSDVVTKGAGDTGSING